MGGRVASLFQPGKPRAERGMSIKDRSVKCVLAGIVGAAILGANVRATPIHTVNPPRPVPAPTFPIVFHTKDSRTGLDIRTTQTKPDEVVVEVKDATVAIRKRVGGGVSETTLTTRSGSVTMKLLNGAFTVGTGAGQVAGNVADRKSMAPVHVALAKSPTALKAKALLTRMTLNPDSVAGHALLLTRALLQSVDGDRTGADAMAAWSKKQDGRATVRRVNLEDSGPEYCWNTYAIAAMHIWDDYASCYDACTWYNYLCKGECALIYDLRAEGAFAWWLKCTAIRVEE